MRAVKRTDTMTDVEDGEETVPAWLVARGPPTLRIPVHSRPEHPVTDTQAQQQVVELYRDEEPRPPADRQWTESGGAPASRPHRPYPCRAASHNGRRNWRYHLMLIAQRPSLTEEVVEEYRSRFVIEPLEPGFGYTLGNSLRRTLLSGPSAVLPPFRREV
jgi:hypothetical protein